MRTFTRLALLILGTVISAASFGQTKTGQICFIRAHGYVGSMINDKVYIDGSLVCKLKNNEYSLHNVSAGDHAVTAQDGGLSTHKMSAPFTVHVDEGKITYVDVVWANTLSCQEITESSAKAKMKRLKQSRCNSQQ